MAFENPKDLSYIFCTAHQLEQPDPTFDSCNFCNCVLQILQLIKVLIISITDIVYSYLPSSKEKGEATRGVAGPSGLLSPQSF